MIENEKAYYHEVKKIMEMKGYSWEKAKESARLMRYPHAPTDEDYRRIGEKIRRRH